MVVIIFAIISCVPASNRKTVVPSPVTVILSARIKVTQFERVFRVKTSINDKNDDNNNNINNNNNKSINLE